MRAPPFFVLTCGGLDVPRNEDMTTVLRRLLRPSAASMSLLREVRQVSPELSTHLRWRAYCYPVQSGCAAVYGYVIENKFDLHAAMRPKVFRGRAGP